MVRWACLVAATIVSTTSMADDRPTGGDDKSMYDVFVTASAVQQRGQLGYAFAVRAATSERLAFGVVLNVPGRDPRWMGSSLRYRDGEAYEWAEPSAQASALQPQIAGEYALNGNIAHGWLVTGGLYGRRMREYPGSEPTRTDAGMSLHGEPDTGWLVGARLGTGYRWTAHPGLIFEVEWGLGLQLPPLGVDASRPPNSVSTYLQASTGWAVVPKGGVPRAGYRARRLTGRVKPEIVVIGVVMGVTVLAAGGLVVALPLLISED